jgi:Arc/MetJ family transcription regulator
VCAELRKYGKIRAVVAESSAVCDALKREAMHISRIKSEREHWAKGFEFGAAKHAIDKSCSGA